MFGLRCAQRCFLQATPTLPLLMKPLAAFAYIDQPIDVGLARDRPLLEQRACERQHRPAMVSQNRFRLYLCPTNEGINGSR